MNEITISIIATVFFAILQAWGLRKQNKLIQDKESGKSIAAIWFICSALNFVAMFIYGLFVYGHSQIIPDTLPIYGVGLMFNGGLLFLFHIPILRGLAKFKGFSIIEKRIFLVGVVGIIVMILLPIKAVMFLVFAFASIAGLVMQPLEILKEKSAGVVDIKLILIYTIATAWWLIFSFWLGKGELVPKIIFTTALTILFITTVLWFRYRKY